MYVHMHVKARGQHLGRGVFLNHFIFLRQSLWWNLELTDWSAGPRVLLSPLPTIMITGYRYHHVCIFFKKVCVGEGVICIGV